MVDLIGVARQIRLEKNNKPNIFVVKTYNSVFAHFGKRLACVHDRLKKYLFLWNSYGLILAHRFATKRAQTLSSMFVVNE